MDAQVEDLKHSLDEEEVIEHFHALFDLFTEERVSVMAPAVAVDMRPILSVLEGVLVGFGIEATPDFAPCVQDGKKEFELIMDAINRLKSKKTKNVYQAIKDIGEALKILPDAYIKCRGAEKDIRRLISAIGSIASPASFAYHCGKNLLVNSVDIFHNVEDLTQEAKKKEYFQVGKELGKILEEVLIGNVRVAFSGNPDMVRLFEGIIIGFGDEVSVDFSQCLHDADHDWKAMNDAMEKIKSMKPRQVKKGLEEMASIAKELPEAIEACKGAETDFEHLLEACKSLMHPIKFAMHVGKDIMVNGKNIFHHVEALISAWEGQNYLEAGKEIGEILEEILVGHQ
jgi:hypothetical protein